jgi:hypothetical protein
VAGKASWILRYRLNVQPRYKHPEVVARVLRKHINPVIGTVAPPDVQPACAFQPIVDGISG